MMKKNGFTLVEVVLVAALIAVVAGFMYSFIGQGLTLYSMGNESADEQQSLRQVLSEITNKARLTDAGDISVSANVLTIGSDVYELSDNKIMRNDSTIAYRIAEFEVSLNGTTSLLSISIKNTKGTQIQTSLSLAK